LKIAGFGLGFNIIYVKPTKESIQIADKGLWATSLSNSEKFKATEMKGLLNYY